MKKKILSLLLSISIVLTLIPTMAVSVSADELVHKHCVCGHDDCTGEGHDTEQEWIALPSGNLNYDNFHNDASLYAPFKCRYDESKAEYWYYLESGYYYLTGDIVFDEPLNIHGDNVVICLNGYNITRIEDYELMDDQPFIEMIKDFSLTLTDCKKTPHYFEYSTENEWKYYGDKAPETGKIDTLDTISDDTEYVELFGGCIYGGIQSGIHNAGGTVTLFNVNIVGNKSGSGGGILTSGKITMNSGNIVGNKSFGVGGGVRVSSIKDGDVDRIGEFIMNGGIIGYNLVGDDGQGSGVYVGYASNIDEIVGSKFIMTGGSITGNQGGENSVGSGIYALGDVTLTGNAKVQKNIGFWGVYIAPYYDYGYIPSFTVGGNAQVTDNISSSDGNLCNCKNEAETPDSYITIGTGTNAPSDNMKIGVSPCWDPFSESIYDLPYTFTTNGTSDDTKYFISDVDSLYVKANAENNKLQIVSRITEQPDSSNNYTVTVDKKNPDVVPSYQWKKATSKDNVAGETSKQLVNGDFGEKYLCRVTYADGSYEDSKDITFYPYFAEDITKTYGDANFTQTVKGNKAGITVTYSSSNPTVATVNSSTGEVTIKKAGSTTIKAVSEETSTHKKAEATYTLTVKKVQVEVPTANTNLTYNGSKQTGVTLPQNAKYTLADNEATNAGSTYQATATLKDKDNYEWKLATPTSNDQKIDYSIAKKSINVRADDKSSYVGSNLVDLTYTADDLCGNDEFTGSLTTEADKNTVKAYDITQGTLTAGNNYSISYTKGTYTVKSLETQPYKVVNTGVEGNNNGLKLISLFSLLGIATIASIKKKKH